MQHVLEMQQISMLPKYSYIIWILVVFLCAVAYANAGCLKISLS